MIAIWWCIHSLHTSFIPNKKADWIDFRTLWGEPCFQHRTWRNFRIAPNLNLNNVKNGDPSIRKMLCLVFRWDRHINLGVSTRQQISPWMVIRCKVSSSHSNQSGTADSISQAFAQFHDTLGTWDLSLVTRWPSSFFCLLLWRLFEHLKIRLGAVSCLLFNLVQVPLPLIRGRPNQVCFMFWRRQTVEVQTTELLSPTAMFHSPSLEWQYSAIMNSNVANHSGKDTPNGINVVVWIATFPSKEPLQNEHFADLIFVRGTLRSSLKAASRLQSDLSIFAIFEPISWHLWSPVILWVWHEEESAMLRVHLRQPSLRIIHAPCLPFRFGTSRSWPIRHTAIELHAAHSQRNQQRGLKPDVKDWQVYECKMWNNIISVKTPQKVNVKYHLDGKGLQNRNEEEILILQLEPLAPAPNESSHTLPHHIHTQPCKK